MKYTLKEIFNLLDTAETISVESKTGKNKVIKLDNDLLYKDSDRYKLFRKNNKCVSCGLEGLYFKKKLTPGNKNTTCHLNMFGVTKNGQEVMFTKDHIIPKSKGGKNDMSNYQTMCEPCNMLKANN